MAVSTLDWNLFFEPSLGGGSCTSTKSVCPSEDKVIQLFRAVLTLPSCRQVVAGGGQVAALKEHYDRVLRDLQAERDELQRERVALVQAPLLAFSMRFFPVVRYV